jgi:DNA-binding beta-propeller fold protein YncE
MRLHIVVVCKLSVIALIGAASVCGTAGIAAAAATAYGPPPPATSVPPGGFTAVITTVSVGPAGGTIGPVSVNGVDLTVTVPRGAFPSVVQITVTAPDLSLITPPAGITVVAGAGIQVTLNGAPYPGTFLSAVTATFRSSKIMPSSDVVVWNGTSFVIDQASTTTAGRATVSFDTDPDFAVESPVSTTTVTTVPGATSPVTGEPFLGEGILAGGLVLAGAGGIFLSRRRRTRALPAGLLAWGARRGRPRPVCLVGSAPIRSVTTRMTTSREDRSMHWSGTRSGALGIVLVTLTAATLAACSGGRGAPQPQQTRAASKPRQIFPAPKNLLAAAEPQPNGTLWALAGDSASKGLYDINLANGGVVGSISVSNAARSVTESLSGVVGLALGTGGTGALELFNGNTGDVAKTVPLGAPARDVVVGSDGATFYVLNGTSRSASVTVVDSENGAVQGTVPVPLNTVSIAPDAEGSGLYVLQPNGQVSQIAVAGGKIMSSFPVGSAARSLTLSPDGGTLYVLKDAGPGTNVAEVDLATESVGKVLPAPAHCLQILVSADGSELYQLVGTPTYGNIQVFPS